METTIRIRKHVLLLTEQVHVFYAAIWTCMTKWQLGFFNRKWNSRIVDVLVGALTSLQILVLTQTH